MKLRMKIMTALLGAAFAAAAAAAPVVQEGEGAGRDGAVKVAVTFDNGKITDIKVLEQNENPLLGKKVFTTLKDNIVLQRYFESQFQTFGFMKEKAKIDYSKRLIEQYDVRSSLGPNTIVRSMSGGNQQKAIIARELDRNSPLLIAVQPTRGLDVGAIESIHREIIRQRDAGSGVLLVSLELDEVMNLSDRILVMFNGEIVAQLDPKKTNVNEIGLYMSGAKRMDMSAMKEENGND